MKNPIRIIFVLFFSFLFVTSAAADQPYKRIQPPQPTQAVDKIEVVEVFLYTCPHCYEFEPYLEKWLENKPADVEFRRMPGIFSKTQIPYAHAFFTAEKLGVLDKIHKPLLEAIHEKKQRSFDEKSLKAFFMNQGVDGDVFTQTYHSNEIETKVKQALLMGQRYGVPGVPSIVINGKYLTSGSLAGSFPNVLAVIDSLVERERAKAARQ
jgi:thiol:disulfide interchange protein DsbA